MSCKLSVFFFFCVLFYLTDILPKKILARDYLKSLEQIEDEDADL